MTLLYTDKNWSMWNTSVDSAELGLAHAFMGVLFAFDYALWYPLVHLFNMTIYCIVY